MSRPAPRDPVIAAMLRPTTFTVGSHTLCVTMLQEGRWTVGVNGGAPSGSYGSQAEAWEAGVREADRLAPPR